MSTKNKPFWIFCLSLAGLFATGFVLRFTVPSLSWVASLYSNEPRPDDVGEIFKGLGEAFMVAAVLAAFVDPYVKFRLGKEIGREIAKETAGQHLPCKLREALESIQDVSLYLVRMAIEVEIEAVESHPTFLKWRTTMLLRSTECFVE